MSRANSANGHSAPKESPTAGVPLLDVARQNRPLRDAMLQALARVYDSGRFIHGPEVPELEAAVAQYCQVEHGIACASGSDALLLALMALGVGPGDEVLLPSYTFFATASAVWRVGARCVFVDIEPGTFNLDPAHAEQLVTPATKAIVPVHLFGQSADMDAIATIAQRHRLAVIEDAAQAIGAEWRGQRAGSLSDVGCISFYPTKNLGGLGDGGMLVCRRPELAERLRLLRMHGMQPRYYHQVVGINSRLDTLQAAALLVKLPHLERWSQARAVNAQRYHELFAARGLDRVLALPATHAAVRHVWNQYTIRVSDGRRDALREHLAAAKIGTEIYYPVPLHLQECFRDLGYAPGSLPHSERAAAETIALPIFAELTAAEQTLVVDAIAGFFGMAKTGGHPLAGPKFLKRPAGASRGVAG